MIITLLKDEKPIGFLLNNITKEEILKTIRDDKLDTESIVLLVIEAQKQGINMTIEEGLDEYSGDLSNEF